MEPKNALSSSSSRRRRCASLSSIRLAERSASMAICLPGIASSVNRAPTSAIRVGALGDDEEIDRDQDDEDDEADDEIAAHHEAARTRRSHSPRP